jgi:hypothetical protein
MLLDIFVTVPSILMTNIAWYIRVGLVLICLIVLFAVAIGAVSFYRVREDGHLRSFKHRPEPVPLSNS